MGPLGPAWIRYRPDGSIPDDYYKLMAKNRRQGSRMPGRMRPSRDMVQREFRNKRQERKGSGMGGGRGKGYQEAIAAAPPGMEGLVTSGGTPGYYGMGGAGRGVSLGYEDLSQAIADTGTAPKKGYNRGGNKNVTDWQWSQLAQPSNPYAFQNMLAGYGAYEI